MLRGGRRAERHGHRGHLRAGDAMPILGSHAHIRESSEGDAPRVTACQGPAFRSRLSRDAPTFALRVPPPSARAWQGVLCYAMLCRACLCGGWSAASRRSAPSIA
jgi:hypothetical protein